MSRRLAWLVALAGAPASAAAGPCAVQTPEPHVLTPAGTSIAKPGGIVVGLRDGFNDREAGQATAWRFRDGKRLVKPTIAMLAPGLMVLALPATVGDVVLESAAHVEQVAIKRGDQANLLAAPRVRRVLARTVTSNGPRASSSSQVAVELIAAAPTEALALVIFGIDRQSPSPRSWATVDHEALSFVVYQSPGRCQIVAPGTLASGPGDHVAFAWVDRSGRLSTMSAEAIVTAEPASPSPSP